MNEPQSRRERLRESTLAEIKALARQQMAESGTSSLSLNAIARAIGMVPSALYRYYASRDELITVLIIDGYGDLAQALEASVAGYAPDDYGSRLMATSLAYRAWALAHPVDFQLIFGNPIPGYHAPPERTLVAAKRVFSSFLLPMQAAHTAGRLRLPPAPERLAPVVGDWGHGTPPSLPQQIAPEVAYLSQSCWARLHGMVMLELTGHLAIEQRDTFARYELEALVQELGLGTGP